VLHQELPNGCAAAPGSAQQVVPLLQAMQREQQLQGPHEVWQSPLAGAGAGAGAAEGGSEARQLQQLPAAVPRVQPCVLGLQQQVCVSTPTLDSSCEPFISSSSSPTEHKRTVTEMYIHIPALAVDCFAAV
jgi:hypothetical protein